MSKFYIVTVLIVILHPCIQGQESINETIDAAPSAEATAPQHSVSPKFQPPAPSKTLQPAYPKAATLNVTVTPPAPKKNRYQNSPLQVSARRNETRRRQNRPVGSVATGNWSAGSNLTGCRACDACPQAKVPVCAKVVGGDVLKGFRSACFLECSNKCRKIQHEFLFNGRCGKLTKPQFRPLEMNQSSGMSQDSLASAKNELLNSKYELVVEPDGPKTEYEVHTLN